MHSLFLEDFPAVLARDDAHRGQQHRHHLHHHFARERNARISAPPLRGHPGVGGSRARRRRRVAELARGKQDGDRRPRAVRHRSRWPGHSRQKPARKHRAPPQRQPRIGAAKFSAVAIRAADRRRRRVGVLRVHHAAPTQRVRRAQPARHIADHSRHRVGRECAHQLVAGGTSHRADPPHSSGRARAGLGKPGGARQLRSRRPQGRARGAGARLRRHGRSAARQSQRDDAVAARHFPRAAFAPRAHAGRTGIGAPA